MIKKVSGAKFENLKWIKETAVDAGIEMKKWVESLMEEKTEEILDALLDPEYWSVYLDCYQENNDENFFHKISGDPLLMSLEIDLVGAQATYTASFQDVINDFIDANTMPGTGLFDEDSTGFAIRIIEALLETVKKLSEYIPIPVDPREYRYMWE